VTANEQDRIDAVVERADGLTRADVLRRALQHGLAVVERDVMQPAKRARK
jgi:hypothetical protein